ncbi:hypothetical protein HO133_007551 [Letharia lupina]|uniref:Uncharacterized protein n=1 Tax=Letharia lupina TaxID=560253 RepID=A0A8H6FIZ8_9LECA|nr:uncharacterized protein HO133_007551 [Letharia lupina]KAF6229435.1 hypothetical protein HO133_007551 [Letharia lupina]
MESGEAMWRLLQNESSLRQRNVSLSRPDACSVGNVHKSTLVRTLTEVKTDRAQLEEYIRATNPAPNGSKDLSEVLKGDIICLEGSPCRISGISSTGRLTVIEGASLIDDMPYAARFNHCYGVTDNQNSRNA